MPDYGFTKTLDMPLDAAIEKVTAELAKDGIGILTRIDVHEKLKEKIGVEMEPYVILGACHPASAYKVIQAEPNIGLMLPCNVCVYSTRRRHGAVGDQALGGHAGGRQPGPGGRGRRDRGPAQGRLRPHDLSAASRPYRGAAMLPVWTGTLSEDARRGRRAGALQPGRRLVRRRGCARRPSPERAPGAGPAGCTSPGDPLRLLRAADEEDLRPGFLLPLLPEPGRGGPLHRPAGAVPLLRGGQSLPRRRLRPRPVLPAPRSLLRADLGHQGGHHPRSRTSPRAGSTRAPWPRCRWRSCPAAARWAWWRSASATRASPTRPTGRACSRAIPNRGSSTWPRPWPEVVGRLEAWGVEGVLPPEQRTERRFTYPVLQWPTKVASFNLDKDPGCGRSAAGHQGPVPDLRRRGDQPAQVHGLQGGIPGLSGRRLRLTNRPPPVPGRGLRVSGHVGPRRPRARDRALARALPRSG